MSLFIPLLAVALTDRSWARVIVAQDYATGALVRWVSWRHSVSESSRALASRWVFGDVATKKPVETTSDDYVGGPVVMDRRGSVSAVKGPGQLAKEVLLGLFG